MLSADPTRKAPAQCAGPDPMRRNLTAAAPRRRSQQGPPDPAHNQEPRLGPIPAGHCRAAESRFWIVCQLRRALFRTASWGRGSQVSAHRTGAQHRRLFSPVTGAPVDERLVRPFGQR
jgi:hypothetical protein